MYIFHAIIDSFVESKISAKPTVTRMLEAPMAFAATRPSSPRGPAPQISTDVPMDTPERRHAWMATAKGLMRAPSSRLTVSGSLGVTERSTCGSQAWMYSNCTECPCTSNNEMAEHYITEVLKLRSKFQVGRKNVNFSNCIWHSVIKLKRSKM